MSKSVKVTTEPYLLIALHAAKYSDHNIFGYLLGTEVGNVTNVTAVLPVCHNAPAGPILEISGQVADKIIQSPAKVVGFYFGTATGTVPVFVERIISELKRINGDCIALKINDEAIMNENRLFLDTHGSCKLTKVESIEPVASVNDRVNNALERHLQHQLHDFEDHMNSGGSYDYQNLELLVLVKGC